MKTEHTVIVKNHNDQDYVKKYWTEAPGQAMIIAASEAYPFGIKNVTMIQQWVHPNFKGAYISVKSELFG